MKNYNLESKLYNEQDKSTKEAYKIGYAGKRHPAFSAVGEDAEPQDIDRAISVNVIDRDNEASAATILCATIMLRPVLKAYIQGLKDGCKDNGNPHLLDKGRQFRSLINRKDD